jgi:hypothetical protein
MLEQTERLKALNKISETMMEFPWLEPELKFLIDRLNNYGTITSEVSEILKNRRNSNSEIEARAKFRKMYFYTHTLTEAQNILKEY